MKKLIASIQLQCPYGNLFLLKAYLTNGTELRWQHTSMIGTPHALSNLQLKKGLPHMWERKFEDPMSLLNNVEQCLGGRSGIFKMVDDSAATTIDYPESA